MKRASFSARPEPRPQGLVFLPLGGSGEIGMNLNLYWFDGKWLMVDLGVTFGESATPGVDVIMPDPAYIERHRADLLGIVLTHAHEDHLGAVPYLWPRLRCPVYGTGFALSLLRRKLDEVGLGGEVPLFEVPLHGRISLPPFEVELLYITHSIPEPNALAIRTPAGTILHTGDWKLDPEPLIGPATDEEAFRQVGDGGVLALIGDSTNAMVEGHSRSEAEVRDSLFELIGGLPRRVAVTCFASNVARVETIARAAALHGRHVALVGRSLIRIDEIARENGMLRDIPRFLTEAEAARVPPERILLICTGSQGEPRAALSRIASGTHPHIELDPGDVVIFSSRVIPGNERAIGHLHNGLVRRGVTLITDQDHFVHASGHPARAELVRMYQLIRPKVAIPVHGEARHMLAHAELARSCQVPEVVVPENGLMIRLDTEAPQVLGQVPSGRLALDGKSLTGIAGQILRERNRLLWHGAVVVTVVVDRRGRLAAEPQISAPGLIDPDTDDDLLTELADAIDEALARTRSAADDAALREVVARAVRHTIRAHRGKKPVTEIHLVRVKAAQ